MSGLRVFYTSIFLFLLFMIQEVVIARVNFPFNGFSLYLAVLMIVLALEDRTGSLVFGFIGGLIMDLSTSIDTPFGQWALVLTIIGYLFSVNRETVGDFTESPFTFVLFVSAAVSLSLVTFLIIGVMLGQNNGGLLHNTGLIFINSLWTFLITPIFLPLIIRIRKLMLDNRERV
ncbi:MAG: rod shape-determining protein MreD [Actinobacteria bacterium]|nr:rod shape-determining protein MreD [Actinomycetota bacterium]